MRLGLGLGLSPGQLTAASLSQQVQTALAGRAAYVLDPSDSTTLWQDTAASVPVTLANDPVGRVNSKWGALSTNFQQSTAASRPLWNGTSALDYDNADDGFVTDALLSVFQNVAAAFICSVFKPDTLGSDVPYYFSTGTSATAQRFDLTLAATGTIRFGGRRLDADGLSSVTSAAGVIVAGNTHVVSHQIDFAGTGQQAGWVNASAVITPTVIAGVAGNTSNTAGLANSIGRFSTTRMDGKIGRMVVCAFIPTAEERALFEAWAGELAL